MNSKVANLLENLKKKFDVTKTEIEEIELDEKCPVCKSKMFLTKPCCGSGTKYKKCKKCGYKILVK